VISTEHKFVFVHIPKTGGTSIKHRLQIYSDHPLDHPSLEHRLLYFSRPTALELDSSIHDVVHRPSLSSEFIHPAEEYFKFTFVRNPWDRLVSYYFHLSGKKQNWEGNFKYGSQSQRLFKESRFAIPGLPRYEPVSFKSWVLGTKDISFKSTIIAHPQLDWIVDQDQKIGVDFIGRFERFPQDFQRSCKRIGMSHNKLQRLVKGLPHKKRSNHKHYSKYYTDETIEVVANWYKKDIEAFNYKYETA
tara:strand:- start:166 stop:903 length:738 start_codon:yes stop_codon:yes gene_type:complete